MPSPSSNHLPLPAQTAVEDLKLTIHAPVRRVSQEPTNEGSVAPRRRLKEWNNVEDATVVRSRETGSEAFILTVLRVDEVWRLHDDASKINDTLRRRRHLCEQKPAQGFCRSITTQHPH